MASSSKPAQKGAKRPVVKKTVRNSSSAPSSNKLGLNSAGGHKKPRPNR